MEKKQISYAKKYYQENKEKIKEKVKERANIRKDRLDRYLNQFKEELNKKDEIIENLKKELSYFKSALLLSLKKKNKTGE